MNTEPQHALTIVPRIALPVRRAELVPRGIRLIRQTVADFYGVTVEEISCHSRATSIVWPRQVGMTLCVELLKYGQNDVAPAFGIADRSYFTYAVEQVRRTCTAYALHAQELNQLREIILTQQGNNMIARKNNFAMTPDPTSRQNEVI